jgi:formylglycine-generating enzyme required for sulfatase activity
MRHPIPHLVLLIASGLLAAGASPARAEDPAPGSTFRDCPACPDMVVIPAGEFVMGSDFEESGHPD